jgi:hypothetical protein
MPICPSLSEIVDVLTDVRRYLAQSRNAKATRVSYLFEKLCAMKWTIGFAAHRN